MNRFSSIFSIIIMLTLSCQSSAQSDNSPWRLDDALSTPHWFSLSGIHRTRMENLNNQYRNNFNGGDQALVFRTNVFAKLNFDRIRFTGEMMDSRATLTDSGTPLNTTIVNPLELLQAHVEIPFENFLQIGSKSTIRGGRITMDVGSRRFVARNRFRNTINGFTGIDWKWNSANNESLRLFYTLPVQRRVSGDIQDNDARIDKEHKENRFWGVYVSKQNLLPDINGEAFIFGLHEKDISGELNTRNRRIYTPGFRLFKKPAKNQFDYQVETALQFGESRSSATATQDLDHFAYFYRFEAGYSFDVAWSPRLLLQYDFASGDDDPNDADNNRFDTLFGARRFEYGPTSIYGAFARSNINTPGIRLKLKPANNIDSFFALRGFWLASNDDIWTTAGFGNAAGQSNSYIGTQIEARVRWNIAPKNILLEAGAAHLFAGDIMDAANRDDATYVYSQAILHF